ncbi:MAG: N-6 DNA methylase [Myxacorys californica WJT36-NPBG1]|jgi:type I restriction enzyme M protein|nr:N-6 DNA methylase [Myxacorys californica WJT36-NPBG1]
MARARAKETNGNNGNGSNLGFEQTLWAAADKMRGHMDAAKYKHVALGLIFLKYISDAFQELYDDLEKRQETDYTDPEDRDEYLGMNVFWVPKEARWSHIQANAKQPTIGKLIDEAMLAIEKENPRLKGVLPMQYARPDLDKQRLGELIDLISKIGLGDSASRSKDILGRVYEYFLGQFAEKEGKGGGEFYTPQSVVKLLVAMIEPYKGRIYDPCCGSGGMFVQSEKFVEAHGGRKGDIAIYGQEPNPTTRRLCLMDLAIRGIDSNIGDRQADSFTNDLHKDLKADYVLANPPSWHPKLLRNGIRNSKENSMKIIEVLATAGTEQLVKSMENSPELVDLESLLVEKNNRLYFHCPVRKKDVLAKPEEAVRQLWIYRLIKKYGYPLKRLAVEYPITFGRDTSKRADIVIFDADRPTVPFAIVEVKQVNLKDGKEQLRSYTHATGAPLALWSDGIQTIVWHRKNPNYFVELPELPAVNQTIEDIAGQPWTIDTLLEKEEKRETEGEKARSLRDLIVDLEDEVLANAGVDVFEEVFKLIFTKLYDEMACYRGSYKYLRFRNNNTAAQLKEAIQALFDEARRKWHGVFPDDDRIKLSADHLQVCVGSLEEWKLFNSNLDVIDDAFEYLVNKSAKGEKGQYFTPRWVIDMCVKMLNPEEHETVIDTACGSAGFTVHSMFHVWQQIIEDLGLPKSHLFTMEKKPERCIDYVKEKVFAIDFDEKSVRVARCLNLIAGDGETNVLHLNTLDWMKWDETVKQDDWNDTYGPGFSRLRKIREKVRDKDYRNFQFDVLMANPPFAGDIKQSDMLAPYDLAHKENGKLEKAVGRDLLFIERNLDFLKPGGRMAIVLPQGRFNNASEKCVREFIMDRCRILAVVGLHPNSFKPHTGTKTSVLFVQKWNSNLSAGPLCPEVQDYDIFFATQRVEPVNNRGQKNYLEENGILKRDKHGHFIVAHDLFNHEGLTQNGIAEAFIEFAKKENLSFFQ